MAQTTLTIFAGDQLYRSVVFPLFLRSLIIHWNSYFSRLTGTFLGLILGLLAWYIGERNYRVSCFLQTCYHLGNGNGRGNAYGTAASVGVFLVPLMFIRLFSPPQYLKGNALMLV